MLSEKGYTVAAIDVRGYGGSSKPQEIGAYKMRELSKDVIGVIDSLGYETAILIGHDWGGPIVWNTAALNETRISAVLGLSVPFFPRGKISTIDLFRKIYEGKFFYQLYFQEEGVAEAEFEEDIRKYLELTYFSIDARGMKFQKDNAINASSKGPDAKYLEGLPTFDTYPSWITGADMDYLEGEFEASGMRGPLNRYRAQQIDFEDLLELTDAKIKQPSAFLTGKYDPVNFFTGSNYKNDEDLRERIGKNYDNLLSVCLLDDAGHWVQQEKPEEVNQFILDFLSQV
tara:strand:- start:503 stop:1360 length:858 start_codon:yes stop_codon:yes gene_type:complete